MRTIDKKCSKFLIEMGEEEVKLLNVLKKKKKNYRCLKKIYNGNDKKSQNSYNHYT